MKKIIFLLFVTQSLFMFSQNIGEYFVSATGGYKKRGYTVSINIDNYRTMKSFVRLGVDGVFEKHPSKSGKIPINLILGRLEYYTKLFAFDFEETHKIYIGGGLTGGYEWISRNHLKNNEELFVKSKAVYGVVANAVYPIWLSDIGKYGKKDLYLVVSGGCTYLINSKPGGVGHFLPNVRIGLRVKL